MLNIAKMVWLFNIRSASSAPADVSMSKAFSDGFLVAPKKFPVEFVPRSDHHERVIRNEFKEAKGVFARYE